MQSSFHNGEPEEKGPTQRKAICSEVRAERTIANLLPTSRQFSGESALEIVSYRFGTWIIHFSNTANPVSHIVNPVSVHG